MTVLEIFIFRGEALVGSRVFSDTSVTVGRGSASMLVLDDRQVSRLHATIRVESGPEGTRLIVRDNESQIGTRLNGKAISESAFSESDTLEIGAFRLKVTRRSMRQHGDFDEDEPTDAGQLKRKPVAQPLPMEPSERATVAPRAPKPPRTEGLPSEGVRVSPRLPFTLDERPAPAPRLPDSPLSELTAGVDESLPGMLLATAPERKAPAPVEKPPAVVAPPVAVAPPVVVAPPPAVPVPLAPLEFPAPVVLGESEPKPPAPFDSAQGERGSALTPATAPAPSAIDLASTQELPREAPAPRALHADDDHDDDEDPFVPSFSLLELLDRDPPRPTGQSHLRLEVIHHCEGHVLDVVLLPASTDFAVGALRLLRHAAEGKAQLTVSDTVAGQVFLSDKVVPLEEIRRGARDRHGVGLLELREGDRAEVSIAQAGRGGAAGAQPQRYHVRFVRQPLPARSREGLLQRVLPLLNVYFLAAVLLHGSLLYGLSKLPQPEPADPAEDARFAEVSLKQIQLEAPPEVKPPEPEPPAPPTKEPLPREIPKARPVVRARVRTAAPRPASAQDSALAALEMIKPADVKGPALKDVVTNINAVSVPADARSRFRVGGAIGKLPTGEVRLSTAGVARDATSSGRELLAKDVGALKGAGGSGDVRGVVKQPPPAALQAAGAGRLSRAQIQKVINEHVGQIQGCYERNLVRDRSLAGKITFDWVISPSGTVASVRVRSSTMAGSAVSACILQEIRGWVFPTPEGGAVSVTYPFIFSAQGF